MTKKYDHQAIEQKWQQRWEKQKLYHARALSKKVHWQVEDGSKKPKFYCLIEFPYPSAEGLHVGHPRSYTAMDILARKKRMQGQNVLFPIGFDAFGLPAENYAIKKGVHPKVTTEANIENFRKQLKSLGFSFDWSREISTINPEYYKWTQWIFLELYKKGLAYKKEMPINWCPSCKIGLANEEVIGNNCERCGAEVTKKTLKQWLLKITQYADRLIDDLDKVDYLEKIKTQQVNWIGRSEGALIKFKNTNQKSKFDKILLATNNLSKKKRIEKLLKKAGLKIKILLPEDLGLEKIETSEDGDLLENAQAKAEAYRGQTDLPILGIDVGFFIKDEEIDPVRVKRNALSGKDEKKLTQGETAKLILDYYQQIAKKNNGKVDAYWKDIFCLSLPDGKILNSESKREVILTDQVRGRVDSYFPMRSLYRIKASGKYTSEQTEEEELAELKPFTDALVQLLGAPLKSDDALEVFTTRPDTLFGATYMVVAPEHELIENLKSQISNYKEVEKYVKKAAAKSDLERTELAKEKTGVELKGVKAINPVNNAEIPIWVADYVLASYGTGAIMAVPAHDVRDWEFAKKFNLPIRDVVKPVFGQAHKGEEVRDTISLVMHRKSDNKFLVIKWKNFDWISPVIGGIKNGETPEQAAVREALEESGYKVKPIEKLGGIIESHFYADNKKVWRGRFDQPMLCELVEDTPQQVDEGERKKHEVVWMSPEEVLKEITHEYNRIPFERYIKGNYSYIGEGEMIDSEEYSGLDSKKGGEKITKWLEKNGSGRKDVNYKLRDWIFSRQHYWGEPIPIVHCDSCAKNNQNVLILHGWEANSNSDFIPCLREDLEKKNYQTYAFDAPNTNAPKFEEWYKFAESKIKEKKLQDFVIVGHSMGALLGLKLAEKYPLKRLVVVAPVASKPSEKYLEQFKDKLSAEEFDVYRRYQDQSLDIEKIKKNVNEIIFVFGDQDAWITKEIRDYYKKEFEDCASFYLLPDQGHMSKKRVEFLEDLFEESSSLAGLVPVPEKDLPIVLPNVEKYQPTETGESPLAAIKDWVNTTCPKCGEKAKRETDTMPNWAGSSWYFLRYCDPKNNKALADKKKLKYWTPVDWYNGGMEHTTLHLLYSRFWHKFLYDIGVVPTTEPYQKRTSHGMILGEDNQKMSKSRGNVVNPDDIVEEYGADTMRLYEMFIGPFADAVPWSTKGIIGMRRFLEKVERMIPGSKKVGDNKGLENILHKTIRKVAEDIEAFRFNTAISSLMEFVNFVQKPEFGFKDQKEEEQVLGVFLKLLSPFAPHLTEELWQRLGHKKSIFLEKWPEYDKQKVKDESVDIIIQVNGKVRGKFTAAPDIAEDEAKKLAREVDNVKNYIKNEKDIVKTIFVSGKLINFVVKK